jgi:hypothetical protein
MAASFFFIVPVSMSPSTSILSPMDRRAVWVGWCLVVACNSRAKQWNWREWARGKIVYYAILLWALSKSPLTGDGPLLVVQRNRNLAV